MISKAFKLGPYLLAPMIFTFLSPLKADETCLFISQYEPDLIIEVSTKEFSETKGYLKYKGSPLFLFSTGMRNGYGGQYFSFGSIPNSINNKVETVVSGSVITVIGEQSGTGTPKSKRKQGLNKLFFPNFGLNYYYYLADSGTKLDGLSANGTKKINSIFNAAEGFWIPSEICKKYVPYGW